MKPNFYIIPETQYWRTKFLYKSSQTDFYNQWKTSLAFYILSTIWRLKMHKRQKDVREKKMKMYFFYYATLWLFLLATISLAC